MDADRREIAFRIEETGHADDRVETQQIERDGRIIEIHAAMAKRLLQRRLCSDESALVSYRGNTRHVRHAT
jgi:hypothetical protein